MNTMGLVIITAVIADQRQGDIQRRALFKMKEGVE